MHLCKSRSGCGNNVRESGNDLGEWTLTDNDQRAIDDGDALGWCLKSLALLGDHLDVADHLLWGGLGKDWCDHGHRGDEDFVERHHGDSITSCSKLFEILRVRMRLWSAVRPDVQELDYL